MSLDYEKLTKKLAKIKPYLNDKDLYHYKNIQNLDVEYTYHSNAIEGNTLTLQETSFVLDGISIGNKNIRELYEVSNHSKAFNYIFQNRTQDKTIEVADVLKIHAMILNNIDEYNKGVYRNQNVGIVGTNIIFPYPEELPKLMNNFNDWLITEQKQGIMHPVEFASQAHFKLVDIHPFIDGNGRTSRLLMNMILLKNSYPPLIIKLEDKIEYIKAISNTRDKKSNDFEAFIYKKVDETLTQYVVKAEEIQRFKGLTLIKNKNGLY